jgi:hypothetical protein
MTDAWFSTMVRLVTSVEGEGLTTYTRSVFVFRAADWESARARAIELGRAAEDSYANADGQRVERQLMRVETLDLLDEELVDGREVYAELVSVGDEALDAVLNPEDSRPTQSGV